MSRMIKQVYQAKVASEMVQWMLSKKMCQSFSLEVYRLLNLMLELLIELNTYVLSQIQGFVLKMTKENQQLQSFYSI